jgi:hypothetical protein
LVGDSAGPIQFRLPMHLCHERTPLPQPPYILQRSTGRARKKRAASNRALADRSPLLDHIKNNKPKEPTPSHNAFSKRCVNNAATGTLVPYLNCLRRRGFGRAVLDLGSSHCISFFVWRHARLSNRNTRSSSAFALRTATEITIRRSLALASMSVCLV